MSGSYIPVNSSHQIPRRPLGSTPSVEMPPVVEIPEMTEIDVELEARVHSGSWTSKEAKTYHNITDTSLGMGTITDDANEQTEDLEIHLPLLHPEEIQRLETDWRPPYQLRQLILKHTVRWLVSGVFVAILYAILVVFSRQAVMNDSKKQVFNFLVIGASLSLGLNIASSLKAMATDFRWWLLSLKKRSLKEVNIILHLDSLTEVLKLAFVAPNLAPLCIPWLLLNLLAQAGIAVLGVTYSMDSDAIVANTNFGSVYTPDLSQIFPERNATTNAETLGAQQYTANSFGNIALDSEWDDISDLPIVYTIFTPNSPSIFTNGSVDSYFTIVLEWNSGGDLVVYTNRTIPVTWDCTSNSVISGGNGTEPNITVLVNTNGKSSQVSLPFSGGLDQTTFITTPDDNDCGPGCSVVNAFEASSTQAWWYSCDITIGNVTNAVLPEHLLGQNMTKMAAAAIALQGYTLSGADTKDQYQYYPAASFYGKPAGGDVEAIGIKMGAFAIGVVATAIQWNPDILVPGNEPDKGVALQVSWTYVNIILCLTLGGQLVLFVVCSLVSNMVLVKDNSHIAIARLLRPIVERLGSGGSTATGEQICEALTMAEDRHGKVVYTVIHPTKGVNHHLVLGGEKRLRAFPRGRYD